MRKNKSCIPALFTKTLALLLCMAMIMPLVACGKQEAEEDIPVTENESKYDIQEADYDTYIEYEDQFLTVEMDYLNENGFVDHSDIPAVLDEVEQIIRQGVDDGTIERYNRDDGSIYVKFSSGIPYLFIPQEEGVLSGGSGGKIITLEPNENDFTVAVSRLFADVMALIDNIEYADSLYPSSNALRIVEDYSDQYTYDYFPPAPYDIIDPFLGGTGSVRNANVTVECLKNLSDYKIIIWEGHGGYNEAIHSALITGEVFMGWEMFSKYKDDLQNDLIGTTSHLTVNKTEDGLDIDVSVVRYYYITSKFVEKYITDLDNALIFLGACSSLQDPVLAQSFIDNGAGVVLGYTDTVIMIDEMISRTLFFDNLLSATGVDAPTVAQAYQRTVSRVSSLLDFVAPEGIAERYTLNGMLEEPLVVVMPDEATSKLLTQINQYDGVGNLESEQQIHYNEKGLVTNIEYKSYGEYGYESETVLTYDTDGRLISRLSGDFAGVEYTYNDEGQIVRIVSWEGGGGEELFEYDSEGKIIQKTETHDVGTNITEYIYNANGVLSSTVTVCNEDGIDPWSETTTYTYDSENRLVCEVCEGVYCKTSNQYDYSFVNFILNEYFINDERCEISANYCDASGSYACKLFLTNPQFYADADGYLAKIVDTHSAYGEVETDIYEFYYDGVLSVPLNNPSDTSISYEEVVTHTYEEAEKLLYEFLGNGYGFEGLEIRQVSENGRFEMTISGEGGAPIYIINWYTVDLDTGEVRNAETHSIVCDLW